MTFIERLSQGWKAWLILFVLTLCASAPGVFSLPALDRDEARFAQTSKQMLESSDYITLKFQDTQRNKKPAGIYWLQAGATALFGDEKRATIATYRLPSWIGAGLTTLATFWLGLAFMSRRAAFVGAALFGVSILASSEAHIAKTDSVLTCLITAALGCLIRLYMQQGDAKRLALGFWALHGLGFLIKGPVISLIAGLTGLSLWLWGRQRREQGVLAGFRSLLWWPGPVLSVALVLPWFIAIQLATGGEFLQGAVGKDLNDKIAGASEGHSGPPGFHLLHLPVLFFPAILFLLPALAFAFSHFRHKSRARGLQAANDIPIYFQDQGLRFIMAAAFSTWVFFELLPTKLSHYVLPAYPALALLCGLYAMDAVEGRARRVSAWLSLALFALGGGILLGLSTPYAAGYLAAETSGDFKTVGFMLVREQWAQFRDFPLFLWALGGAAMVFSLIALVRGQRGLAIMASIGACICLGWHIRGIFLPSQVWLQSTVMAKRTLAEVCGLPGQQACAGGLKPPERVLALGIMEPSLVFTLGTQTLIPPQTPLLLPDAPGDYPIVYLINLEHPTGLPALRAIETEAREKRLCARKSRGFYALNYSKGDPVHFVALRLELGPCKS